MVLGLAGPGVDDLKIEAMAIGHNHIAHVQQAHIPFDIHGALIVPGLGTLAGKNPQVIVAFLPPLQPSPIGGLALPVLDSLLVHHRLGHPVSLGDPGTVRPEHAAEKDLGLLFGQAAFTPQVSAALIGQEEAVVVMLAHLHGPRLQRFPGQRAKLFIQMRPGQAGVVGLFKLQPRCHLVAPTGRRDGPFVQAQQGSLMPDILFHLFGQGWWRCGLRFRLWFTLSGEQGRSDFLGKEGQLHILGQLAGEIKPFLAAAYRPFHISPTLLFCPPER